MKFAFTKKNYTIIIIGLIFILSGLVLMIGGGSEDPAKFSPEIFNFQRLTLAPVLLAIGFLVQIFGILIKEK